MIIEKLRLEAPEIYRILKGKMIGGEGRNLGVPDDRGFARGGLVRDAEIQYHAEEGSYWYRPMWPNDTFFGQTEHVWNASYTAGTQLNTLGVAVTTEFSVPTTEAMVCFGWYCDGDLDQKGHLKIQKHTTEKSSVMARIVLRQEEPDHYFIDIDRIVQGTQNEKFRFLVYNGSGSAMDCIAFPIIYRIASRSALNLELPMR